ncbi:LysE family transporter [Alteromonas sp. 5E99-2]|nr:LysE family transporter [Alteromonas sp. 5E99-2]
MVSFFSGIFLGLSLIVAIGAQNIWVLSQSMAGANRLVIATVCIACDASLIIAGVFIANEVKLLLPSLVPWLTYAGIAMLLYLAFGALTRAIKGSSGLNITHSSRQHWRVTALSALAISLLNPHVYLDTLVLLGSLGALQAHPSYFAAGACVASCFWFGSLTTFAPKLRVLLSSPLRWRIFDTSIGFILLFSATQLWFI